MITWEHFIPGVPKPQGSKSAGVGRSGRAFLREDNKGTKPWRKRMVEQLQGDDGKPLIVFDSAVWVRLRFVFVRPKSHPLMSLPTSKRLGDVDKLTRNVLDALTQAGVIADDKFVVKLRECEKVYGPNPGVHIEIGPAVPNPFDLGAELFRVPREMVEAAQPSTQVIHDEALKSTEHEEFVHNLVAKLFRVPREMVETAQPSAEAVHAEALKSTVSCTACWWGECTEHGKDWMLND